VEQLLLHLIGDYITQSDWMAQNKTKSFWPAWVHAQVYSTPFLLLTGFPFHSERSWMAWWTILLTHFFIDRYRLARYVVWAKNWAGDWRPWTMIGSGSHTKPAEIWSGFQPTPPWRFCKATGYPPSSPDWLATWLLIIADNTLHLTINYAALRWL